MQSPSSALGPAQAPAPAERSFYTTVAVNRLSEEDYEVAAMTEEDLLMRCPAP
ncbi:MAG: hypothetical protein H7A46_09990 [Verrucomicrobiales bacterium]|nr:hypothetical protein [Verrucomicrobiales bacterium]